MKILHFLWLFSFCVIGTAFATNINGTTSSLPNLLSGTQSSETRSRRHNPHTPALRQRRAQSQLDRRCNAEIGRVSRQDLAHATMILISGLSPPEDLLKQIEGFVTAALVYDVAVWKVCGSCNDLGNTPSFCDASVYGSDATHSALAFIPLNKTTDTVPIQGRLRTFFSFRGSEITAGNAPTESWPSSMSQALASVNFTDIEQALASLDFADIEQVTKAFALSSITAAMAGGVGAVGIVPDYIGFGASLPTHNRTFGYRPTYNQAAFMGYKATESILNSWTEGCTQLTQVTTMMGSSEGGFATACASVAMRQQGFRILKNFAHVPFFDMDDYTAFIVESYDKGLVSPMLDNKYLFMDVVQFTFAFSSNIPGLANSGTNQTALSPAWNVPGDFDRNVIDWLKSPDPITMQELWERAPQYAPEMYDPNWLQLIRDTIAANLTQPCRQGQVVPGQTDKLCEAILEASVWDLYPIMDFPVELCYSPNDSILSETQYPDSLFINPNVTRAPTLYGIPVMADHIMASQICAMNVLDFLGPGLPNTPDDQPNLILPLAGDDLMRCSAKSSGKLSSHASSYFMATAAVAVSLLWN